MEEKPLEQMTDDQIKEMAKIRIGNMKEEDVVKIGKAQKNYRITTFVFCLIFGAMFLGLFIFSLIAKLEVGMTIIFVFVSAIFFIVSIGIVLQPRMFKWSLKDWAIDKEISDIKRVRNEINSAQNKLFQMQSIGGKKIKYTEIIDSYTEYTDKLHGFLNYQEIIQHRMYKFLVTFEDNSTKIYTVEEGKSDYEKLMRYLKKETKTTESIQTNQTSTADELSKFKKLLDEGAITEEEYQKKKERLLNQ